MSTARARWCALSAAREGEAGRLLSGSPGSDMSAIWRRRGLSGMEQSAFAQPMSHWHVPALHLPCPEQSFLRSTQCEMTRLAKGTEASGKIEGRERNRPNRVSAAGAVRLARGLLYTTYDVILISLYGHRISEPMR